MPKWAIPLTVILVGGGLFVGYLGLTPRLSDRDRVMGIIANAEQAANQGDWGRLLNFVADDYSDSSGLTKNDLKRMALEAGRSFDTIRVKANVQGLAISDKGRATALVLVTVLDNDAGQPQTREYSVTATFEKRGRHWLITKAEGWQEEIDKHTGE